MNFDLELFKKAIESDTKELAEFHKFMDESINSVDDDYLNSLDDKADSFINEVCGGVNNSVNFEVFVKTVLVKYAYLQGIKDGQTHLTLDLEKFNKSRERYLGKKKNSKFAGTILKHIKED